MATNGVPYNPSSPAYPWNNGNLPSEAFGRVSYRFYMGATQAYLYVDGFPKPPGVQLVQNLPQLEKQFKLLGQAVRVWENHGLVANTLSWQGGTTGYYQFLSTSPNQWIAHTGFNQFQIWNGSNWSTWTPPSNLTPH